MQAGCLVIQFNPDINYPKLVQTPQFWGSVPQGCPHLIFFFLVALCGMWDLSSLPRIEPAPSALEGLSLNYWIIRGVPTPTLDASYKSASDCSMPGCISFTISQSLLKLMCIEWVMPSNHLILCYPFSCPQSFPASGFFSVSWPFASGGLCFSVSPSNEYSGLIFFRTD